MKAVMRVFSTKITINFVLFRSTWRNGSPENKIARYKAEIYINSNRQSHTLYPISCIQKFFELALTQGQAIFRDSCDDRNSEIEQFYRNPY